MGVLTGAVASLAGVLGWRRALLAFAAGLVASLALPSFNIWPLMFVAVPVMLALMGGIARRDFRTAFLLGWLFGLGYFISAFHWIGYAFLVDKQNYLWMMPFAVGGLAAAMAVYWGLAAACANATGFRGLPLAIMFAVSIGIAEILRGTLFTGFPWAVPGLAVDGMGALAQTASVWGMTGLTFLILTWSGAWPFLFSTTSPRLHRSVALVLLLTLPLSWAWGHWRLQQGIVENVAGVSIRIVQPAISQNDKWRGENARGIFDQLLALSAQAPRQARVFTHVVWPESAVPFLIDESAAARSEVSQMLGAGRVLVTGSLRREKSVDGKSDADKIFNSILAFDGSGEVIARYDKWRLVPGGEFLPFEWLLEPLGFRKVVTVPGSFAAGAGPETLTLAGAPPVGFSICYEAIFPDALVDPANRPAWLINVTNDGWFGTSTGPYQHLAQLRLRAIEQGLPVVRAANTGISAVIDPFGRYIALLPLGQVGVIDSALPRSLPRTVFGQWGLIIEFILMLLLAILAVYTFFKPVKTS